MTIDIISCVWQRPEQLIYTLTQLNNQTYRDFRLWLINNNKSLQAFVNKTIITLQIEYPITVIHNDENHGAFSRTEVMCNIKDECEWFLFIDDDYKFDNTLLSQWYAQLDTHKVQSWNGFRFIGNYWQRDHAKAGEDCHYLWGSNMLIPSHVIEADMLTLPQKYWNCDDLFICYYANHIKQLRLCKADIVGSEINVDGKDTYTSLHATKIEFLKTLRATGWKV